jgi:hypothetical protein
VRTVSALLGMAFAACPLAASADPPPAGLIADAGIGVGVVSSGGHTVVAPSVVNLQVGYHLRPATAIGVRFATALGLHEATSGSTAMTAASFVGPVAEQRSRLGSITVGAGLFTARTEDQPSQQRVAIDTRVACAFARGDSEAVYAALELFSGIGLDDDSFVVLTAHLGLQVF